VKRYRLLNQMAGRNRLRPNIAPPWRWRPRTPFGLHLKELRGARGMTPEELADFTGFFRTSMSRLETGAANPTFDALLMLVTALDVTPADFSPPLRVRKTFEQRQDPREDVSNR
jgi:transcriptional regulator with XRE-family HTH domain